MKRAFTLVEMLVVIGLLCLFAGLVSVLMGPAKDAAAIVVSKSNLHHLQISTALYQSDYGGDGNFGTTHQMGLPKNFAYETLPLLTQIRPPRAPAKNDSVFGICYWVYYNDPNTDRLNPSWADYTASYQGQAVLYSDPFNNAPSLPLDHSPFARKRVIGVTVDGNLVDRFHRGDWMERSWWHENP